MAKPKKSAIVKPSTRVGTEQHVLETLFDGPAQEIPELKSIGFTKLPGEQTYIAYVITTRGREVISVEVDEPNVRAIAEETSKINFVQHLADQNL